MTKKLANYKSPKKSQDSKLTNYKHQKFKIAFGSKLDSRYCFKTKKGKELSEKFHYFLEQTVYKDLSITEVDELFLRTKGPVKENLNGIDLLHYGKDRTTFRVHGYYDSKGYFNVYRLDLDHKYHK